MYARLEPHQFAPSYELCQCKDTPLKLMSTLSAHPLHCMTCHHDVPTENLTLSPRLADALADWQHSYDALDWLWLEAGSYEQWAREQLSDIGSAANLRGRLVQQAINRQRRCYYWYFQDQTLPDFQPITACPVCGETMQPYSRGTYAQRVCERDSIVTIGD